MKNTLNLQRTIIYNDACAIAPAAHGDRYTFINNIGVFDDQQIVVESEQYVKSTSKMLRAVNDIVSRK